MYVLNETVVRYKSVLEKMVHCPIAVKNRSQIEVY